MEDQEENKDDVGNGDKKPSDMPVPVGIRTVAEVRGKDVDNGARSTMFYGSFENDISEFYFYGTIVSTQGPSSAEVSTF